MITGFVKAASATVLAIWLVLSATVLSADDNASVRPSREFATSWFLVRLEKPLVSGDPDGSLSLRTANPALDAAIADVPVEKIELALRVAAREARHPQRLARYGLDRTYRFHVPEGSDILGLVERFATLPGVELAEPDYVAWMAAVTPDDPWFPDQWNLDNPADTDVDAPEAWEIAVGEDVILGIVDTGIDSDHPDLAAKLVEGYDFVNDDPDPEDDAGHGTAVASIASADTNNTEGIAGACWNCRLMPLKAFLSTGMISYAAMADALVWGADRGARVMNMSGGGPNTNATLLSAMFYAYDAGVVLVSSAGNEGANGVLHPARYLESLAIGATDDSDHRRSSSNFGPQIDVVAPGEDIWAAMMGGGYGPVSGTSHAAPLVTGLLGIMETVNPAIGRHEARHLIWSGAEDQVGDPAEDTPGYDIYMGWGRVNMERTLQGVRSSMSLRVDGKQATRPFFDSANPLAASYDFVRGDLEALDEDWEGVHLGDVICLENDSPDPDTTGNEDLETPAPGHGFFYLGRFNGAPGAGSYGGSSGNRDRVVPSTSASLAWTGESDQAYSYYGVSVSGAGDVNNDGYDDVIVGAYRYDNDQPSEGAAFVYLGSSLGLQQLPAWTAEGDQTGSEFGFSVAGAGDVNGDGFDDVIVGAYLYDNGQTDEGRAYAYLGNATGLDSTAHWTVESDQEGAAFGWRVRPAGDINDDGYDDVLVVSFYYDGGQVREGKVFLYQGSASGLSTTPAWSYETNQAEARMAGAGTAGDVNGDGYDDVVIGSQWYNNGQTHEGRAWIFHGSMLGLLPSPAAVLEIDVTSAGFGYSAYSAGDVNGDGFDDVVIGAYGYTNGAETAEGAAFLYPGSASGVTSTPAWSVESGQADAWFGLSVQTAGDVNDDGYDDILVSSSQYDLTRTDQGGAWVFLGSALGPSGTAVWSAFGSQPDEIFGWRSAGAGDVNGDGFDDVIVGARRYDNGEVNEGRAVVYHGPLLPSTTTDCPNGGSR